MVETGKGALDLTIGTLHSEFRYLTSREGLLPDDDLRPQVQQAAGWLTEGGEDNYTRVHQVVGLLADRALAVHGNMSSEHMRYLSYCELLQS